eukprot:1014326-Amphidinium_carterae.1
MEIRTTYKQTYDMVINGKQTYKQHHCYDFFIITSGKDMDEEYVQLMIIKYYKQARAKKNKSAHENKFMTFLSNYYPERTRLIMHKGLTRQDAHKKR